VYSALEDTDEDSNDPSKVMLFYKGISVPDNELRMSDDGDIWNREHIWAKSHGDFGTRRGPNVFDEVPGTYVDKDSFEPRDEVKGDVARNLY